jgi:hypothetical protein
VQTARAADLIPPAPAGNAFASCTGRAGPAWRGSAVPAAGSGFKVSSHQNSVIFIVIA